MASSRLVLPRRKPSARAVSMNGICQLARGLDGRRDALGGLADVVERLVLVAGGVLDGAADEPDGGGVAMVSATSWAMSPKPFSRSAETGRSVPSTIARQCASASSRVTLPSRVPTCWPDAPLEVAMAPGSRARPSTRAEPASQALAIRNAPGAWWSARKRVGLVVLSGHAFLRRLPGRGQDAASAASRCAAAL